MSNRLNLIQRVSSTIITIVCSLIVLLLCLLVIIQSTLFNPSYMKQISKKSNYATHLTQEINKQIENLGLASNIPQGVLNKTLDEKVVEKNTSNYFAEIYTGEKFILVGIESLENNIRTEVISYAAEANSEVSEANLTNLNKKAVKVMKSYIELPYLITYGKKMMAYQKAFLIATVVTTLFLIILFALLLYLLKGYLHRLLRNLSYLFVSTGATLVLISGFLVYSNVFGRIAIMSKALYDFIYLYLATFNVYFLYTGLVCILLGIILAILSEVRRNYLIKKRGRESTV